MARGMERENIVRALKLSNGGIYGKPAAPPNCWESNPARLVLASEKLGLK